MVIAFGLSCCSAALTVLSPVAATARAIAVIVSFTHFMVFLRDYRLAASQVHKLRADSGQVEARRPLSPVMARACPGRLGNLRTVPCPHPTSPASGGGRG